VNDWLDVMLEEIARKKREAQEAKEEQQRREASDDEFDTPDDQSR